MVASIGVIGYMSVEGFRFVEALYMTVITITTAGFTEVRPLSDHGRIFTICMLVLSWISLAWAITRIIQYIITGEINKYFKNRKLMMAINQLNNHVIICGFGRNGQQAAQTLRYHKKPYVVIEKNEDLLHRIKPDHHELLCITGDATDDELLRKAGIERAHSLICSLPTDADNVFIVLSARSLNSKLRIISRASDSATAPKLKKAGADHVIMPDRIGGTHMATLVSKPDVIEFIDFLSGEEGESIHMESVDYQQLPPEIRDTALRDIMAWKKTGVNCIGVRDKDGKFLINPPDSTRIVLGMKVFVLGTKEQIEHMKGNINN
ncbi:potassium channel family protein [Flavihumibacter petaseus]|uniref:Potassium channel protein n=1 Tax=Flavihumibacter petaseus NBRC 106054 TaxID=1220578 RepID=A0A0E9N2R1_9BACT|nr:potassium channel protein [Flavihumibacter petaseus]GAO43620.1 potassium channel protein [Flavihumibacter petaseus NBRC 106054]